MENKLVETRPQLISIADHFELMKANLVGDYWYITDTEGLRYQEDPPVGKFASWKDWVTLAKKVLEEDKKYKDRQTKWSVVVKYSRQVLVNQETTKEFLLEAHEIAEHLEVPKDLHYWCNVGNPHVILEPHVLEIK